MMQSAIDRRSRGRLGEQLVAQKLQAEGFTIAAYNFANAYGEIDLIARKDDLLLFVEVKLRTNSNVDPAELILLSKQKKIIRVAKLFLSMHTEQHDVICRFDVALVEYSNGHPIIQYIPNAFDSID